MKTLYYVTNGYPFTSAEKTFIQPEIDYLKKQYNIVLIACLHEGENSDSREEADRLLSGGVILHKYMVRRKSIVQIILGVFRCIKPCFFREFRRVLESKDRILKRLILIYIHYTETLDLYSFFINNGIISEDNEGTFYSFWFHKAAHAGILLKKKYHHLRVVSRIHGYDLYNEQGIAGYQPFKTQMADDIDMLLFICKQGKEYFLNHFSKDNNDKKYIINRLGVYRHSSIMNLKKQDSGLHLISCSTVCEIKRLNLIVDGLALINDVSVNWTHFGDGPDFVDLIEYANNNLSIKNNISYKFEGRVENGKILEYYRNTQPECIINVSYSEGSPVSIQEAISYGMLVIATDVGGNSEMVDGNGVLLPSNPKPEDIAKAIEWIALRTSEQNDYMRAESIKIWANMFDREKNLIEFARSLEQ